MSASDREAPTWPPWARVMVVSIFRFISIDFEFSCFISKLTPFF
jgi:hypothetical protein